MSLMLRSISHRRVNTAEQVYEILRDRIINLDLKPHQVLSRVELAEEFGVSQTPVREALLKLEVIGLVDVYPQSRTEVSPINAVKIREVQFMRRALETEVCMKLMDVLNDAGLAELRSILDAQESILEDDSKMPLFMRLDKDFHSKLFELVGQSNLNDLVQEHSVHLDRMRMLQLPLAGKRQSILTEHREMLEAVMSKDKIRVMEAVQDHLTSKSRTSVATLMADFPEYF
jgi:DNA-binding GntR family transcriptional regulator